MSVEPTDSCTASNGVAPPDILLRAKKPQAQPPQLPRSGSPPSPQPHPQSPRSPRERIRRGHSPLAVLINPPSQDDSAPVEPAAVSCGHGGTSRAVDSLSLALQELGICGGSGVNNIFDDQHVPAAKEVVCDPATDTTADDSGSCTEGSVGGVSFSGSVGIASGSSSRTEDDFLSVRPVTKRSSSLKSTKTPPGTPCQVKKAVRFADAFGLDLAYVKHVLDSDNPPVIPLNATRDLELEDPDDDELFPPATAAAAEAAAAAAVAAPLSPPIQLTFRPAFAQPGQSAGFNARVMAQKVVLEGAALSPGVPPAPDTIRGYVRVANLAFEKVVGVRVTFDAWRTSTEVAAWYVADSGNGMTDQFTFTVSLPPSCVRQQGMSRVAFCITYSTSGQTYWDNNFGENYSFDCVPEPRGPRF